MRITRLLTMSAVTAAAVTLSACAAPATPGWATYVPTSPGGDTALLRGVLQVRDGCVMVASDAGEYWLPIFPDGVVSGWRDGLLVGDALLADGGTVEFGGGELGAAPERSGVTIPAACEGWENAWMVSNTEA